MAHPPDPALMRVLAAVEAARPGLVPPRIVATGPLRRPERTLPRGARARRRAEQRLRTWESRRPWIGLVTAGRERALVAVAQDVVGRIAASPAWASPQWEIHRIRLDLTVEMDEIDDLAYRLAASAAGLDAGWADATWWSLIYRVAALSAYADGLAALDHGSDTTPARDVPDELAAAQVRAEDAADHLKALSAELRDLPGSPVTRFPPA